MIKDFRTKIRNKLSVAALGLVVGGLVIFLGLPPSAKNTTHISQLPAEEAVLATENTPQPSVLPGLEAAYVTKVVDGDTIEVKLSGQLQKIRYLGINTPETVDPRRKVQCFGHEASNKNKELVENKQVWLEKDVENKDKYDRLLRYVYLPVGGTNLLLVNDLLVREGYAQVYTFPPNVKYVDRLIQAQQEAKATGKGLWGRCQTKKPTS